MALIYLSCAWVAGIYLGSRFNPPLVLIFIGLIPLPLLFLFRQQRKTIILTSLSLFVLLGGAFYYQSSQPTVNENCLQFYNDQGTVAIKGMVNADPEVREKSTRLRLSATEIELDKGSQEVEGTALIFVPRYPTYSYGDELQIIGELETPPQLDDFDYKDCVVTITSSITGIMPVISTL